MPRNAIFFGVLVAAYTTAAGTLPVFDHAAGQDPVSVVFDKPGNIWISMQPICEVWKYTPDWRLVAKVPLSKNCAAPVGASGLAVDSTGALYAAVKAPGQDPTATERGVYVVEPWGVVKRVPGTEQIQFPNSLAFDHNNGDLYITDMVGGAIWRVPRGGSAELWFSDPLLKGFPPNGANGLAVYKRSVVASITYPAAVARIPILADGAPGPMETIANAATLGAANVFALDDIALDVFGNIYAAVVLPPGVARITPAGEVTRIAGPFASSVVSLAFASGRGERKDLFIALNPLFGGALPSIEEVEAGVPGMPMP